LRNELELLAANGGSSLIYYRGQLIKDRNNNPSLSEIADTALRLAEAGALVLFQRRHGSDDYEYIALRSTPAILTLIKRCSSAEAVS
jgi:hypothetical protein